MAKKDQVLVGTCNVFSIKKMTIHNMDMSGEYINGCYVNNSNDWFNRKCITHVVSGSTQNMDDKYVRMSTFKDSLVWLAQRMFLVHYNTRVHSYMFKFVSKKLKNETTREEALYFVEDLQTRFEFGIVKEEGQVADKAIVLTSYDDKSLKATFIVNEVGVCLELDIEACRPEYGSELTTIDLYGMLSDVLGVK